MNPPRAPRRMAQPAGPPVPFAWSAQTPEDEHLLLEDLQLWLTWLIERYRLDHRAVPDCWRQHTELIEELSALHLAWEGAFAVTSPADAPLQWHERFANARGRLTDRVSRTGCRPGEHRTPPRQA